ncbi:MAG TPA: hypothetical protein VL588_02330, partial [Bdellovibrionota bacterium]|nr:hypothetical protein [Bdellovibrionota bacterium]
LHLSKIAESQAAFDPDMEYELWKSGAVTGSTAESNAEAVEDLEGVTEYIVDESALKKVQRKPAAVMAAGIKKKAA